MHFHAGERIGIIIDGANNHGAARAAGMDIDYKNLLSFAASKGRLIRAEYYTAVAPVNSEAGFLSLRPLIDWLEYNGWHVIAPVGREHMDATTGRRVVKSGINVETAVGICRMARTVDHLLLFSGNGTSARRLPKLNDPPSESRSCRPCERRLRLSRTICAGGPTSSSISKIFVTRSGGRSRPGARGRIGKPHTMSAPRKKFTRDERHAIALLMIKRGNGAPIVSRKEADGMTTAEIIETFFARVHIEHIVPHALNQNNHPSNLQFMAPDEHAPKTKRDVTEIAKTKRIEKKHEAFRAKLLAKAGGEAPADENKPKRKATIKSRGFQKAPAGTKHDWKTGKRTRT